MPLYEYQAVAGNGEKKRGYVNADTLPDAKGKLSKTNLLVWNIREYKQSQHVHWKRKEVQSFTKELAKLLQAGLPLFESLLAIEEKYQGKRTHTILLDLIESVKQGKSLSAALLLHPKTFDPLYAKMVENAEKSGNLEGMLLELNALMEKQGSLRKKILQAVSYPLLLFSFSILILLGLLFFIIPSLSPLFVGRSLGAFTRGVLAASAFCIDHGYSLLLGSLCSLLFLLILSRFSFCSALRAKLLLRTPLFKDLIVKHTLIRFSRSTATLLEAGIPMVEAIDLSKNVVKHSFFAEELEKIKEGLLQGNTLSKEFEKSAYMPHFVVRMVAIAEKSGKAAEMFHHIAAIYEEEFSDSLQKCTGYLQPLLMLFIGAIVGLVLLSVLLPLTDVSSFIE
ncbi:MAG: type II secretion system F family protein [Chlamydiota bacterium]